MKTSYRVFFILLLFCCATSAAEDRLAEYYRRAVPRAEQFAEQIAKKTPQEDFAVFTLFNNIALLVSANDALPKEKRRSQETITRLLRIGEEMQDKNPDSPTFGNFRWYWRQTNVTDPNAVEFALARLLSIRLDTSALDTPDPLSEEDHAIVNRLLERSVAVCLNRRIRPDYTNIALYNAVHLILLGQVLNRPDVTQEGKLRLGDIVANIWNHGIFEYNSPAYYFVNVDALQLGFRHAHDQETKEMIQALLELFWTDMSLHWYKPGLRLTGAQSRTDNFLFGTSVQMTRVFSFAELAPYDHQARYHGVLNSFRALYQPSPDIVALNGQYPRWVTRNWGPDPGQWATLYMCDDIALGTAGTRYEGMQNMVQTVDMPDYLDGHLAGTPATTPVPRSYFIADGRENPYGIERSPTGSAGQQKALHLDALWTGTQRTVDSLGIVLYPAKAIADPEVVNVQSHFVVRKPESIWVNEKPITLVPHKPITIGHQAVVFRYQTQAFGVRVVWSRDQAGQPVEVILFDDGNDYGVYRLTVEHGVPIHSSSSEESAGAALWVRIGSHLESEEQFSSWRKCFHTDKVHRLDIEQNNIAIEVTGQDGIVSVSFPEEPGTERSAVPGSLGILTLNGNDLGRPILEKLSAVAKFIERRDAAVPIVVDPSGTYWTATSGYSFFDAPKEQSSEPTTMSSSEPIRINHAVSWQLQVEQSGEYYLWGRVRTRDAQHDSFWVETAKRLPDNSFMRRSVNLAWHLGTREDWTWVRLPIPIRLEKGIWQLTLKPREYEGKIDQLFLTSDPHVIPRAVSNAPGEFSLATTHRRQTREKWHLLSVVAKTKDQKYEE